MRRIWAAIWLLAVLVAGCGDDRLSEDEYVERLDEIVERAGREYEMVLADPQGRVMIAEPEQLADFTPQDLQVAFERVARIQVEVLAAIEDIEPPEQLERLHDLFFRALPFEELAARAGTAATWEELSDTPEMAAYRSALADDKQVCADLAAEIDSGGGFAIAAWLSTELKDIGDRLLGCADYPENPNDVYRPPVAPTS